MVDELISIEQLERIRRMVEQGYHQLALAHIDAILDERKNRVRQFEEDMFDNVPV
jgi:hypothetical protein